MKLALKLPRRNPDAPRPSLRERFATLKGSAAKVMRRKPAPAADPILSAIAASHAATAAFDAVEAELEQRQMTPELYERETALGTAEGRAERAVWQTVPTTPTGRRALVEFARYKVSRVTHPNGTVDDAEYWLGLILDAFSAMVDADPSTLEIAPQDACALAVLRAIEREWAAQIVHYRADTSDISPAADARDRVMLDRKWALLNAAASLPGGSREARHAKALAVSWSVENDLWQRGKSREQHGDDGRLLLDIMESLAASSAAAQDPHVALLPVLRQAYAWDRASRPVSNVAAMNSFEEAAAGAVQRHCWDTAGRIIALPAPRTLAGLGALALALSVQAEEAIGPAQYDEERRHAASIRAMMSIAGVDPLPDWCGFGDEDDSKGRYGAMLERMGAGSLPAWALAGKSGPDDVSEA